MTGEILGQRRVARQRVDPGREQHDCWRVTLEVPLALHELASLIGVSRNSVVRALSTLRSRRLVATAKGKIRVLDADALRRYAAAGRQEGGGG